MGTRPMNSPRWSLELARSALVLVAVAATFFGLTLPAWAAQGRDELLRLVPEDVGFCFILQDLRQHTEALLRSPFADKFRASPLGVTLAGSPEARKLQDFDRNLEKHLNVSWATLRDEVLGDAVILAYKPGPPGKPEQEQGLLLLRARDAKLLSDVLARLNEVQKQAGDLKELQALKHEGREYYRRVERKEVRYYYLRGPVLAFTSQEAMIRQVIDLDRQPVADAPPPLVRKLNKLGDADGLATLWINPRAFDADLEHKLALAKGPDAVVLKTVLLYWKALDGIGLTAAVQKEDIDVRLSVLAREGGMPGTVRKLFSGEGKPSELWARFPPNALLTAAGNVDAVALTEFIGQFLTDESRKAVADGIERGAGASLGRDLMTEVLPYLGPDCGFCLAAPGPDEKGWFPHAVFVLRIRPGERERPLGQALLDVLNSFAMIGVFSHNSNHPDQLNLKSLTQDKVEIKYLTNDKRFPLGLRPAYTLKGEYLILASSPEAVRRFTADPAGVKAPTTRTPLLRLSVQELGRFLTERRQPLSQSLAEKQGIPKEEADARLSRLVQSLQLFDSVQLSQQVGPNRQSLVLRLKTAQPLR